MKKQYFCNPLNMDYRYQFIEDMRSGEDKISREAADPSMILFQGKYYIFASMTLSVWVSEDMVHWESTVCRTACRCMTMRRMCAWSAITSISAHPAAARSVIFTAQKIS